MPGARYAKRPRPSSTPRSSVSTALSSRFDTVLKTLRSCARKLAVLEPCLQDELRILERLYYKGVNQHRTALFWRRVEETRRLGWRVLEMQLQGLMDDLRYAFYVEQGAERNPKILRSAWSRVPDAKYVNFIFERTRGSIELTAKARERFAKAFQSFSLMMQTGAFLQLSLALTAIVSRLDALVAEMSTVLGTLSSALRTLREALGGKKARTKTLKHKPGPMKKVEPREDTAMEEMPDEDLGSTVVRRIVVEDSDASEPSNPFWLQNQQDRPLPDAEPTYTAPSLIVSMAVEHTPLTVSVTPPPKNSKDRPGEAKKAKEKKKKKRDEIDDIFGML